VLKHKTDDKWRRVTRVIESDGKAEVRLELDLRE